MLMLIFICLIIHTTSRHIRINENYPMFRDEHVIFSSSYNITKILVPADRHRYQQTVSEMPIIFFTITDSKLEGGACIYVLQGLAAFEVLEGGRDSTACLNEKDVYFGAQDGLYKYESETMSAKKYGPFHDNIIQLQKANGTDEIYILTVDHEMYKVSKRGTVKTKILNMDCAREFVLDMSNNIYYVPCNESVIHVLKSGDIATAVVIDDFKHIQLMRPAFIMEDSVPLFGDGVLYLIYSNGRTERKDIILDRTPTAVSVDAALYLAVAVDGKIYEFNVMEAVFKSMYRVTPAWPQDVTKIITSVIENGADLFYLGLQ